MATLVCFHAHPDDECLGTGGVIAQAADQGHRVVLVVATGGELGEVPDDLGPGETLVDRRRAETERSGALLGVARIAWLGYRDSGMEGWSDNDAEGAYARIDVDEAAARLAAILTEEAADVVTVYDDHGGYGHPDHVQVHRVGRRAAEVAGTPVVYEATSNRDEFQRFIREAAERGEMPDGTSTDDLPDVETFGTPEAQLTTRIDVSAWVDRKLAAIACHASQVTDTSFFLGMPPEAFAAAFGTEWFVRVGAPPGVHEDALAGLGPASAVRRAG